MVDSLFCTNVRECIRVVECKKYKVSKNLDVRRDLGAHSSPKLAAEVDRVIK